MATIIKEFLSQYQFINEDLADPRTKDWPMMGSPWPCLTLVGFYLYFVYRLGPSIMANRPPMKIDRIMQVYNVVQIVLNAYLFYKALSLAWLWEYSYTCEPIDYSTTPKAIEIAFTVYVYFGIKVLDLLDTVFFVLRKKYNQISFLHVYHHAGMIAASWGGVKYLAGGHGTFVGVANSFVHVIMYTHYLVTSLKIVNPWWKKYITQLQLFQFVLMLFHFSQLLWTDRCGYPLWPLIVFIPQNLFMTIMFGDFYYKTYIKKSKSKKCSIEQNGQVNYQTADEKSKTQ